jgi:UDP-N-acetylglucosamine acyltransferase
MSGPGIHPSASVADSAKLAHGVKVGAFAVVGEAVELGEDCLVHPHAVVYGPSRFGAANIFHPFCVVGGDPQDYTFGEERTELVAGDKNIFREYVTVSRGTKKGGGVTRLGNENFLLAYTHIGHDCQIGSNVILSSNAQMAGHVTIGDYAIIGGMSGVHQFVRIGAHSMLGGASALVQDIPPFVIAAGNKAEPHGINVEGLRRRGFSPDAISALRSAYRLLYKNGLSLEEAKVQLRELATAGGDGDEPVRALVEFVEQSQRGIIR